MSETDRLLGTGWCGYLILESQTSRPWQPATSGASRWRCKPARTFAACTRTNRDNSLAMPAPPVTRPTRKTAVVQWTAASQRATKQIIDTMTPVGNASAKGLPNNATVGQKVKEPTIRPKKKRLSRRKPKIQFALVEEHRCPYCLDAVSRNDPRGVKECDVCHTLHHADCWSITGVCQVPHLNT
jgi:hypothetical protein